MSAVATVIVPAYNSGRYLDRVLTTLVGHGDELEAIIVTTVRRDATAEIADEAASLPLREGQYAGLAAATGTYVRVVDLTTGCAPRTPSRLVA